MKTIRQLAIATLAIAAAFGALAGPSVGGDVTIKGNKSGSVVVTGGKGSVGLGPLKGGEVDLSAGANVNSAVIKGGKVGGSVNVIDNKSDSVVTTGGQANVNSFVMTK
jgi:hypothetical protein